MLKIIILNVLLFVAMFLGVVDLGFQLGWADTGNHDTATWLLYYGFMLVHLIINFFLITSYKANTLSTIALSNALILIMYLTVAYIYT
jgi:hypothetical protein